ncbi:extracellular solute-binding protein [Antarctobacter sp.]|uniref:extracellular solute-binding protein n=1 Tax=Antarctobacter sp. TaxID=1872577 RepID=UPI003A931DB6
MAPVVPVPPKPAPRAAVEMANTLTLVSWGGTYQRSQANAYLDPYLRDNRALNAKWDEKSYEAVSRLRNKNAAARLWDLVDVVAADAIRLCDEGLAEKIDHDRVLAPGSDGSPATRDFGRFIISACFVPQIAYSMTFGYRTDKVGGRPPRSVCDVFDLNRYPGKRALEKRPDYNMVWALLCDGVPEAQLYDVLLTRQGQERALAKLDTIKRHVVWWQSGAETPQLLADGEVVMGSGYNGRLFSLINEHGAPVDMLWDRQVLDLDGWIVPTGLSAKRKARVMDFLYFATDTQRLSDQAKYIAYGPARRSSAALPVRHASLGFDMTPHLPTGPENVQNALVYNHAFWARHRDTIEARFATWLAR